MNEHEYERELHRDRRNRWLGWLIPLGIVVLLFGGIVLYSALTGTHRKFGEACEETSDCSEPRAMCLVAPEGSTCTRNCERATDCPAGYRCEPTEMIGASGAKMAGMMKACLK